MCFIDNFFFQKLFLEKSILIPIYFQFNSNSNSLSHEKINSNSNSRIGGERQFQFQNGPKTDLLPQIILESLKQEIFFQESPCNIPDDAVGPGSHYISLSLPANLDSYISVFVSNVAAIDAFWIQIIGEGTTLALEDLMDRLEYVCSRCFCRNI